MTKYCHPPSAFASLFLWSSGLKNLRFSEYLNPREGCYKFRGGCYKKYFENITFFTTGSRGLQCIPKDKHAIL